MFVLVFVAALLASPVRSSPPPVSQPAHAAQVAATSGVAGRLVVREGGKALPLSAARKLAGKKLALELRSGAAVVQARLDDDGWFVAPAAPGRWRLEYLAVGDGAEFFDPPREIEVRAGQLSCAGQLELSLSDVEAELGANAGSKLEVKDACSDAHLRTLAHGVTFAQGAVARPVPEPGPRRSLVDVLSGFRGEALFGGDAGTGWRGTFILGLPAPLDSSHNFLFSVSAGQLSRSAFGVPSATSNTLAAGVGFTPFAPLELQAGADWLQPRTGLSGGPGAFASLRFGSYGFGIGLRGRTGGGGTSAAITLDLSPIYVIGSLL